MLELVLQNFFSWDNLLHKLNFDIKVWHIIAIYLGYQVLSFLKEQVIYRWRQYWANKKAAALRARRDAQHFEFGSVGKDVQNKLLKMDCGQLRKGLDEGEFTSVDLVNFYGHRCQTIGRDLGLTTSELFESAMALAKRCDKERKEAIQQKRQLPFLHGIPFSVKDMIDQKGCITTSGLNMRADHPKAEFNGPVIQPIHEAGAIPLVRGNIPQGSLGYHSLNYIWGAAKNPLDQTRVAGGSSGGDAGLVASNCIPIAIGVDLGGSIRIPASFNGLVGMKPTQGRFLLHGMVAPRTLGFDIGSGHLKAVAGPLAHTVQDCIEIFKIFCQTKSEDVTPFQADTFFKKELYLNTLQNRKGLKIGYIEEIATLPISPAVKRGMRMAKEALIKAGYEVVNFNLTDQEFQMGLDYLHGMVSTQTIFQMFKDMRRHGETLTPGNWANDFMINQGEIPRAMILGLLKLLGNHRHASSLQYVKLLKPFEYEKFMQGRYQLADEIHQRWQEAGLTALLTPMFPHCAFPVANVDDYGVMYYYSYLWSVLHYPAGSFPITKVREDEQTFEDNHNDNWTSTLKKCAEGSAGMPVSVQVVGRAYQDESVLAVMKVLEKQVGQEK